MSRIAVIAALSIACATAGIYAARTTKSPAMPPYAVLLFRYDAPEATKTTRAGEDRALSLALASMSPAERARVLDLVSNTTARLETKLSPLGTDLGDDDADPVVELQRDTERYVPLVTAARELDRGRWSSKDVRVRVAGACSEAANGETCASLWDGRGRTELERRARFFAWSVTAAAIIAFDTDDAFSAGAQQLRERTTMPSSPIALVLTRNDLAFEAVPERDQLRDAARRLGRAMAANKRKDESHLESLGRVAPAGRSAPWLALGPRTLLIVPRLSKAMSPKELADEIAATAGAFVWVIRP